MIRSVVSFVQKNHRSFVLFLALIGIAVFSLVIRQSSNAQINTDADNVDIVGPLVGQPTGFAVSTAVRDLPPVEQDSEEYRKFAGIMPEMPKWNKDMINPIIPGFGANAPEFSANPFVDPLLVNNDPRAPQVMPTPNFTFEGVNGVDRQTVFGNLVMPPDTNGDVGPNHYISIVNGPVGIYNKTTGVLATPLFRLSSLFAGLPPTTGCGTRDDGDPIALYDALADRWMLSQFSVPTGSTTTGPWFECIAISQTADPTGAYYVYAFQTPTASGFPDYPKIGIWRDAIYMTDHQNGFLAPPGAAGRGTGFFAFDRNKMLVGDPTATFIYFDRPTPGEGGIIPSDIDGITPPPANAPQIMFRYIADEFGSGFIDGVRPYQFIPNFTTPANSTLTVLPDIPVSAFDARQPANRPDIEQPPPALATQNLDSLNDRAMFRVAYQNVGTTAAPDNRYLLTWGVNVSGAPAGTLAATTFTSGVRWAEITRDGGGVIAIRDQGTHAPGDVNGATGINRWMQHGAHDNDGNIAIGYSVSSTTVFPSARWAGRTGAAPAGVLNEGEAEVFAGTGVQQQTNSRWGDYSSMSIDPTDGCTFYYHQEYRSAAQNANAFSWNTRVGRFRYPSCTDVLKGTLNVTVTNCQTSAPVAAAIVNATGGYAQPTNASGVASFSAAPGTYTVTGTKSLFSIGTANATVTNGNTTNVAFCIQGAPLMGSGGNPALTAESCLPANSAADPGETVTVTLPVTNTGAANTTNLVGTLQATGGATSPSGPQNYGVVVAGGATVSRPFTFTVNPAMICGDTITLTLALQDGAANLGTVTYTMRTGVRPGSGTSTTSYTGPPVAVPDATAAGVNIPLTVAGVAGNVTDLNFRFDTGGACDGTLGNTNAAMDHTFIGDLTFKLTPPDGAPTVTFQARRGGVRDNICLSTLDDDGGFPNISTLTSTAGQPQTGNFAPETTGQLSLLDGENPNGNWTLNVSDNAGQDTGSMRRFSLVISSEGPSFCCGGASPSPTPTPTNTPTATPTSTPTPTPTPGGASAIYAVDVRNTDFDTLTTTNPLATRIVPTFTGSYFGGDFAANNFTELIAVNDATDTLNRINVTTGAVTPVGSMGAPVGAGTWGDLSYDRTTSTMYAMSNSATTGTSVYTVNLTTGLATLVASNNVTTNTVIDGAIHPTTGVYYGVDITADNLVTINKTTAAVTIIGPVGVAATFAQGMDFDDATGTLYWAAYRGAAVGPGQLRTINITTGASTLIGDITNGVAGETIELDAFAVASSGGGPTPTPTATPITPTPTATPTPGPACLVTYTNPPVAIPDNLPAGVNMTIPVSGVGTISDLDFRFDGTQSAAIGDTNVAVDHTWIGDLIFKLTSPGGTTVTFFDRPGVPATAAGCNNNNLAQLLLNDDGAFPTLESQCNSAGSAAAFPTGTFLPNNPLSGFDGQNANGNWTLNVSDNAGADTGSVRRFSMIFNNCGGATPSPTATPTNTPTATPTNTPTATPTATPTNTVQFAAASIIEDETDTVNGIVNRTGDTSGTTIVTVSTNTGGTANLGACAPGSGVDHPSFSTVLTFGPGITSQTFPLGPCGDLLYEGDETVPLRLTNPVGGGLGAQNTATLIINDTANQYKNTAGIDIFPGPGPAPESLESIGNPYPSTINVTGAPANVHRVRVTLYDTYHALPDNLDILLVSPTGRKMVIMGDSGGVIGIPDTGKITITFADQAGQVLPNSNPLTRGKFEPTTWETVVGDFPLPAPIAPYDQPGSAVGGTPTLYTTFGQLDGNGTWSLFVRDDNGAPGPAPEAINGRIAAWGLELLPATAAGVEVSGRVMTPDGRGLRNAVVSMVDSQGITRTATTSSFGYYHFEDVEVGAAYVVAVQSRRYRFAPRVIQVFDSLTDVDFTGQE